MAAQPPSKKDYDEDSGVLTITVKGDDWSEENLNQHVYTMRFKGVYQLPNSDFENWASDKEPGNGWNSFASAGGTFCNLCFHVAISRESGRIR